MHERMRCFYYEIWSAVGVRVELRSAQLPPEKLLSSGADQHAPGCKQQRISPRPSVLRTMTHGDGKFKSWCGPDTLALADSASQFMSSALCLWLLALCWLLIFVEALRLKPCDPTDEEA